MLTPSAGDSTKLVILLDVDNTLLDNDRFGTDLQSRLEADFGADQRDRYESILDQQREELGYVDYLRALQSFRLELQPDPEILAMGDFVLEYPFEERLYPTSMQVIEHLSQLATTAILSDGDAVLQPRKVRRAGLWQALGGRVMIYVHKQDMLADVQRRYPAAHYVTVDDKRPLLSAMKRVLGHRLTTIFVRQGHYALDAEPAPDELSPDRTIESIGELLDFSRDDFLVASPAET